MNEITSIDYQNDELLAKAQSLADKLHLNIKKNAAECLYLSSSHLSLKLPNFALLSADFTYFNWLKRKNEGKKQGLVRACKPTPGIKIIDATAGWGKDSAILATFGAEVISK